MLIFLCPYCGDLMKIPRDYLGKPGRCTHCGGRVALIGNPKGASPQMASKIEDAQFDGPGEGPEANPMGRRLPMTAKQAAYLGDLGVPEEEVAGMDLAAASERIEALKASKAAAQPPTGKQVAALRKMGLSGEEIARIRSKVDAARIIEDILLRPTKKQMDYLRQLGATEAELDGTHTKAAAAALIDKLRKRS